MTEPTFSPRTASLLSGDDVADRRLDHARGYATAGEPAAAAELMEQALERVPDWAVGWFVLGEFREAAGDRDGAIAAWERATALDPDDRCGAVLRLARLGARAAPDAPPAAHVRDLFDGYAPRFEASLVGKLGYRTPERLAEAIEARAPGRIFAEGLDLGCGTGLMARALGPRVGALDGVDLSPAMIEVARASGLYRRLVVDGLDAELGRRDAGSVDLVTAADVFCYLGDLGGVFAAVARVLAPGGIFAFSVEKAGDGGEVVLRDSLRYGHGRGHVEDAATRVGLTALAVEQTVLRRDRDVDVAGLLGVFTKS
jgi:predicted TPR repeat methyltransferase